MVRDMLNVELKKKKKRKKIELQMKDHESIPIFAREDWEQRGFL